MRILFVLIVLFGSNLLAGTIDPRVSDQKYKDYGSQFENVVRIKGMCKSQKGDSEHLFFASAVIIKPNWALTAAHVVMDTSDVRILVGNKEYSVKSKMHEKFDASKVGFHDIALCYSEKDFEMKFYPDMYSDSDEEGNVASMSGYGMTGTFSTGSMRSDGFKRAGSNKIRRSEKTVLICDLDDPRTELEFLIASGDSGGGLFIGNKLAGIHTFVMASDGKPDSDYGDESAHTRVSLYNDWIEENTK